LFATFRRQARSVSTLKIRELFWNMPRISLRLGPGKLTFAHAVSVARHASLNCYGKKEIEPLV
ncbi:MAG TPA: hypothetical protein VJR26_07475, partial [Candidatus Acidoferrales bacterium]|nr:hypothetical protein [Candidatus Acidoferrales bacterium]